MRPDHARRSADATPRREELRAESESCASVRGQTRVGDGLGCAPGSLGVPYRSW